MRPKIFIPQRQYLKQIDNRWCQVKMVNPFSARQAFAFCAQGDIGYIHGGYNCDEGLLKDMYMGNFNEQQQRQWYPVQQKGKQTPGKLRYHTLTSYLYYLICLGGQKSQLQNNQQVFVFNLKTKSWSKVTLVSEDKQITEQNIKTYLGRDSHCCHLYKKCLYIFGGYSLKQGDYANRMLKINLQNLQNTNKVTVKVINSSINQPSPRSNLASCVYKNSFYIFGGTNFDHFYDQLWAFNFDNQKWQQITHQKTAQNQYWPEKRKGAVLVSYQQEQALILFGGMQNITRQLNDLSIYLFEKKKWVKIHSYTNNIYDASPTIKKQVQDSPTIIFNKVKNLQKNKNDQKSDKANFKLGVMSVSNSQGKAVRTLYSKPSTSFKDSKNTTKSDFNHKACRTQMSMTRPNQIEQNATVAFEKKNSELKMSVVKQKKYRQFLARKKRLLSQICSGYQLKNKRPYSPISQCLNFSINQLGEQHQFLQSKNPQFHLPKVVFDDKHLLVIGKKPCARDGHAAFTTNKNMYIIGGDRHTVSFNDTHLLKMDKAIQSISYYT